MAIADIRPYNVHRAFHGDWASPAALEARPGLMAKYGWKTRDEAEKHVKVYRRTTTTCSRIRNVEAVIIALPLHLHAPVAIEAMLAGKHVLTEKLMGHNVAQCKVMGRVADEKGLLLAVGHQRHYSILYDNAVNLIRWGVLGQLHTIQAQWHRGNLPGSDSWAQPLPGGEIPVNMTRQGCPTIRSPRQLKELKKLAGRRTRSETRRVVRSINSPSGKPGTATATSIPRTSTIGTSRSATARRSPSMAELCRWRLWSRTGGGLMAELGSHQLDAAGIFVSALRKDGKKAHPLTVHAVGGRYIFPSDREAEDHVCCMFEFPGPDYDPEFPVGLQGSDQQCSRSGERHPRLQRTIRTRKWSSPTRRSTATASAATAKSSWAPRAPW